MSAIDIEGTDAIDEAWLSSNPSSAELDFATAWATSYPAIDLYTERLLIPGRKFRYDFVHYFSMVAIEIQGYGPGHYSVNGVQRDNDKSRLAAEQGWLVVALESEKIHQAGELPRIAQVINDRTAFLCLSPEKLQTLIDVHPKS